VIPNLPFVGRGLLWLAERIVPAPRRVEWRRKWRGELWDWMNHGPRQMADSTARRAALQHAVAALQDSLNLRFDVEALHERWSAIRSGPAFPPALCVVLVALIIGTSSGLEKTRRLAAAGGFGDADRLVILSQTGILMGQRLGLREIDVQRIRRWC